MATGGGRGIVTPYEGRPSAWDDDAAIPAPLVLHEATVGREWVDYNGHMSESCYLLVFGDSADAFFRYFGVDDAYRSAGHSLYTAETHLHHRGEASVGDRVQVSLTLLDIDAKRLHIFQEMVDVADGSLLATAEQMLLHVDTLPPGGGRVVPMPQPLLDRLERIRAAHAALARPAAVGHVMGIPR